MFIFLWFLNKIIIVSVWLNFYEKGYIPAIQFCTTNNDDILFKINDYDQITLQNVVEYKWSKLIQMIVYLLHKRVLHWMNRYQQKTKNMQFILIPWFIWNTNNFFSNKHSTIYTYSNFKFGISYAFDKIIFVP